MFQIQTIILLIRQKRLPDTLIIGHHGYSVEAELLKPSAVSGVDKTEIKSPVLNYR